MRRSNLPASGSSSQAFPWRQLTVLALCRICEPIAFMSIFPYIYYMIESFHVTEDEKRIALYAGLVTSSFAFAEALSSSIWGRLSDKIGRKPILICGLFGTGISMLLFGFARNLPTVLFARALGGLLNGNIAVLQTTTAEVVQVEAHKAYAFALFPSIWCVGSIIGSVLGGGLADPVGNYPDLIGPGPIRSLLERYPYLLPNLVCTLLVAAGMIVGVLFLEETHEDLQTRRDVGLEAGRWIIGKLRRAPRPQLPGRKYELSDEQMTLLGGELPPDYQSAAPSPELSATAVGLPPPYQPIGAPNSPVDPRAGDPPRDDDGELEASHQREAAIKRESGVWAAFTRQVVYNIIGFGILAYHTISAEQLLTVLFSLPESEGPAQLPFWFTGGFALPTKEIGYILSVQGALQMVATMVIFPRVQRRLGTLTTFRLVVLTYPLLYVVVPYLTLVPVHMRTPAIYAILVWKVTAQAFAFPSNNIMLANAVPKRALGTFNGFATMAASSSRAVGPTLSGLLQATGLARGILGLPWWFNAAVALAGAVLSLFMVEEKRVCGDPEKPAIDAEEESSSVPSTEDPDTGLAMVAQTKASNASTDGGL